MGHVSVRVCHCFLKSGAAHLPLALDSNASGVGRSGYSLAESASFAVSQINL
jgi:hypothetical protein